MNELQALIIIVLVSFGAGFFLLGYMFGVSRTKMNIKKIINRREAIFNEDSIVRTRCNLANKR